MAETTESQTGSRAMDDEIKPVAWRWSESNGERWFDWTTDWTHHDRAISMGMRVEYAVPDAAVAKERERWIAGLEALHREAGERHNYYLFAAEQLKEPNHG